MNHVNPGSEGKTHVHSIFILGGSHLHSVKKALENMKGSNPALGQSCKRYLSCIIDRYNYSKVHGEFEKNHGLDRLRVMAQDNLILNTMAHWLKT